MILIFYIFSEVDNASKYRCIGLLCEERGSIATEIKKILTFIFKLSVILGISDKMILIFYIFF